MSVEVSVDVGVTVGVVGSVCRRWGGCQCRWRQGRPGFGRGAWVMWENCRDFPVCACSPIVGVGVYGNPASSRICPSGNVGNPRFVKIAHETADGRTPTKPRIPDKLPRTTRHRADTRTVKLFAPTPLALTWTAGIIANRMTADRACGVGRGEGHGSVSASVRRVSACLPDS
ncbi:hypothetical protein BTHE_1129 [Bifidobacterium thermophilum]|nr:hypothetical protein BTHE_1129 [Bifidobacterium thermophilum]